MDNPEPRAQYLNVVLRQIDRTALRIPQFQREFVWDQRAVLELLESIGNGYPIGSILTWKVDRTTDYFAGFREGPFPPADTELSTFEAVLDGAQRLSTLYGCLTDPSSNGVYRVVYDLHRRMFAHATDSANSAVVIPMASLFNSREFLDIQGGLVAHGDEVVQAALDLYSTFQNYQIPIVALASDSLEEVVEVFRRVNSTGTPLSSVDFVRALTWRSGFDLEETFQEIADQYEATPLAGLTRDLLVKCLALTAGLSLDPRDVVRLKTIADHQQGLDEEVGRMRSALDHMASVLERRFDIRGAHEVPYEVQRLLLFSLCLYDSSISEDEIEAWLWRSTFAEEYQGKPESYISQAVRDIRDGALESALAVRKPVDPDLLATRTRRAGAAVSTGVDLLLRRLGARSLLSGDPVGELEPAPGLVFSRRTIEQARATSLSSGKFLSNVVLLDHGDAQQWKRLRSGGATLGDLYEACEAATGEAHEIWLSQGMLTSMTEDVEVVLRERSRALLDPLGLLP